MRTPAFQLLLVSALLAPTASAAFTVTGTFQYVDRAFSFTGFTGAQPSLPIRFARVEVIDNVTNTVLASGETSALGAISIAVPTNGTADIVVRCFARSDRFGSNRLRVTNGTTTYSVSSNVFSAWNLATNLDVGTVVGQKVFSGSYQGSPFNLLDQMVAGIDYVKSLGSGNPSQTLTLTWPNAGGSYATGLTAHISEDDGYDDMVILHEFGHVVHNHYSDSDSPGGSHSFGQSDQDPRLSFGEGFATYFAGAVRQFQGISDPAFYMDCNGTGGTGIGSVGLRMRHENGTPYSAQVAGEADEGAVFCTLWDLADTTATPDGNVTDDDPVNGSFTFTGGISGERAVWNSFIGPFKTAANTTIRDLWNGMFSPTNYGHQTEVEAVFNGWDMLFFEDALEPNNDSAAATPIVLSSTWSATRSLYYATSPNGAPGDGDQDWYRFPATAGSTIEIETRYPGAAADANTYADTFVELRRPNGTLFLSSDAGGSGRNGKLTNIVLDLSGNWLAVVRTTHLYRKTGSYDLRVRLISGPAGGCTNLATSSEFGVGKAGSNGTPDFVVVSQAVIPTAAFTLRVDHAPSSASGMLFLGLSTTDLPFDQGHLYVSPLVTIPVFSDATGTMLLSTPLSEPSQCGLTIHLQAIFPNDPGAIGTYHTAQTERVTITFGG